jgi:hypothetical protein
MHLKRNEDRESYARHLKRKAILERIERDVLPAIADQLAKNYKDTLELDHLQHQKFKQTNQAILKQKDDNDADEPMETNQRNPRDDGESSDEEAAAGGINAFHKKFKFPSHLHLLKAINLCYFQVMPMLRKIA